MASMTEEQPREPTDLVATDLLALLDTAARQTWPLEHWNLRARNRIG